MILDLALAFAAGLISFASTCVLPLVPAYITYMGGRAAANPGETPARQQARVLSNALLFVAGFATAFTALGASAGLLGQRLNLLSIRPLLLQVAGAVLVLFGIALFTLGRIPGLMGEKRFDIAHRLPRGGWASYPVGLAFAIGWTPCVGPILAAILVRAGSAGTAGQGAILLASYSAGLGVPFMVAASLSGVLTRLLARVKGAYGTINAVAAVFLIAMGLLIFSNRLTDFNSLLPYVSVTTPWDSHFQGPTTLVAASAPLHSGDLAPDFTLKDIDGQTVNLASLRGKPILVNFWATWCGPCRQELPMIAAALTAHQEQGLTVIEIDYGRESAANVRGFWAQMGLPFRPVLDPNELVANAYGVGLKTTGLPVSVFIDRSGRVSGYEPFAMTQQDLDQQLAKIL